MYRACISSSILVFGIIQILWFHETITQSMFHWLEDQNSIHENKKTYKTNL